MRARDKTCDCERYAWICVKDHQTFHNCRAPKLIFYDRDNGPIVATSVQTKLIRKIEEIITIIIKRQHVD